MKRQAWALCLGVVFGGTSLAQPPAEAERYPQAPEMPGTIVSKPTGAARPTATVTEMQIKPVQFQNPAQPTVPPVLTATQLPYGTTVTAQVAPISPVSGRLPVPQGPLVPVNGMIATPVTMTGGMSTPACAPGTDCTGADAGKLAEWLRFQSTSKQTGHYPPAATPPLTAWFPCKSQGGCSTYAAPKANCANGNCGGIIQPAGLLPAMPAAAAPNVVMPVQNVEGRMMQGSPALTQPSFQKVVPAGSPTMADPLTNFRKMDGMSFTSGWAPTTAPAVRTK